MAIGDRPDETVAGFSLRFVLGHQSFRAGRVVCRRRPGPFLSWRGNNATIVGLFANSACSGARVRPSQEGAQLPANLILCGDPAELDGKRLSAVAHF